MGMVLVYSCYCHSSEQPRPYFASEVLLVTMATCMYACIHVGYISCMTPF